MVINAFDWQGVLSMENLEAVGAALRERLHARTYTIRIQNTAVAPDHQEEYAGVRLRDEELDAVHVWTVPSRGKEECKAGGFIVGDTHPGRYPGRVWGATTGSNVQVVFSPQGITLENHVGQGHGEREQITIVIDAQDSKTSSVVAAIPLNGSHKRAHNDSGASAAMQRLLSKALQRDTLHAFTLTQPWASLVSSGAKHNETRSWTKSYRGPLALHAAKTFPLSAQQLCFEEPFPQALAQAGYMPTPWKRSNAWNLPLGHVVAIAWLEEVWQITTQTIQRIPPAHEWERAFGNYGAGRFVWTFSAVYRLQTPLSAGGSLGLWEWQPPDAFWNELQAQFDSLNRSNKVVTGKAPILSERDRLHAG